MSKTLIILFLAFLTQILGCGIVQSSKTTGDKSEVYYEDLTNYRAKPMVVEEIVPDTVVYVEADSSSLPVTEKMNILLDTASAYTRATTKYIDGFTIQVYGGNDRALAQEYRLDIIRNFPDLEPKMVFEQPNYKVRIGQYYTRLEAQQLYAEVKSIIPKAILIPARIYIR